MNRKITDAGVAGLDLRHGRAELLEEIMSQPALAPTSPGGPAPARRRWIPVAAAAAVLAVVGGAVWIGHQGPGSTPVAQSPAGQSPGGVGTGDRAVLDEPGWTIDNVNDDREDGGEIAYVRGEESLEIHWRPADQYDGYVEDRADIGPSRDVVLLGEPSLLWAYSDLDHTVIRPPSGAFMIEVRGGGMDEAGYLALLDRLRLVDRAGLMAHLPDAFVTDDERPDAIAQMLAQLPLPDGFDPATVASDEPQRYHLIANVTAAVTCAWIDSYLAARESGDAVGTTAAQEALGTARDWAVLREIADDGGWSEAIWDYADLVVAGSGTDGPKNELAGYRDGLGCAGRGPVAAETPETPAP
ncbi:hypothetical protein [Nocardioides humi]|uniref:Uncharacterized protein n=1 Tax=Nocardioides humi TaxID=449461 RepID=A0ABN2BZ85_9ACTN|nr:hypothetical protein [Nocardioides humi]